MIQQEERICPLCKNGAEDKIHFGMNCTHFEELGAKMLQLAENKRIAVKSLDDERKVLYLYRGFQNFVKIAGSRHIKCWQVELAGRKMQLR